jgi:quinolinate synthase
MARANGEGKIVDEIDQEALLRAAAPLIDLAIAEDVGPGDATSESTIAEDAVLTGRIVAKAHGVVAGLPVARAVFYRLDPAIRFVAHVVDGQEVVPGELLAEATGRGRSLLAAERTVLNFLQRMSGIATLTRQFVDAMARTPATVLDTRKTLPGFRTLDKYAVRMGGGQNHRFALYDMILIKDNHVDAAGGILPAVQRAREHFPALPIEVEVRDFDELAEALSLQPPLDRIMLDNMDIPAMRRAVALTGRRVPLEASGGLGLDTAAEVAATGVDYISVGSLTHSVRALDISMKIEQPGKAAADAGPAARIAEIKAALGDRLAILCHQYQRDEVLQFADYVGDSLQLARDATQTAAEYIVFCGVHFMAETAAILARPGQQVYSPEPEAGCYLADTASLDDVAGAWALLDAALGHAEGEITPVTYVNSSAQLKAFCGERGGIVCTSGNAARVVAWALAQRPRVFFFPDQHLGRNSARAMGIADDDMLLWDTRHPPSEAAIRQARVILWPGACNVHQRFRPEQVGAARARYPGVRVLVHPECRAEVVDLADAAGSTAYIVQQVDAAPPGSRWAIGTESHLVQRLQKEHPEQEIRSLSPVPAFCRTMGQITVTNLAAVLESLAAGRPLNRVTVAGEIAAPARLALERMLAV